MDRWHSGAARPAVRRTRRRGHGSTAARARPRLGARRGVASTEHCTAAAGWRGRETRASRGPGAAATGQEKQRPRIPPCKDRQRDEPPRCVRRTRYPRPPFQSLVQKPAPWRPETDGGGPAVLALDRNGDRRPRNGLSGRDQHRCRTGASSVQQHAIRLRRAGKRTYSCATRIGRHAGRRSRLDNSVDLCLEVNGYGDETARPSAPGAHGGRPRRYLAGAPVGWRFEGSPNRLRWRSRPRRVGRQSRRADRARLEFTLLLAQMASAIEGAQLPAERPALRTGARQSHPVQEVALGRQSSDRTDHGRCRGLLTPGAGEPPWRGPARCSPNTGRRTRTSEPPCDSRRAAPSRIGCTTRKQTRRVRGNGLERAEPAPKAMPSSLAFLDAVVFRQHGYAR